MLLYWNHMVGPFILTFRTSTHTSVLRKYKPHLSTVTLWVCKIRTTSADLFLWNTAFEQLTLTQQLYIHVFTFPVSAPSVTVCSLLLQWYMVTLVHVYNRWKNSEISCFVNGELASYGDIAWFVNTSDVSVSNVVVEIIFMWYLSAFSVIFLL